MSKGIIYVINDHGPPLNTIKVKLRQVTRHVVSSELNLERSKYLRKRTIQPEGKHERSTLCLEAGELTGLTELKSSL